MRIGTWKYKRPGQHPGPQWHAEILGGGWYDDSNPRAEGETEEEAVAAVICVAYEMIHELVTFVQKPTIKRGTDQE